jgi:hypothetical protein
MSTLNEREALLRRALHAAAEAIEPHGDGLERIQARLHRPRPLAVAWAEAAWTDVRLRAPAGLESWLERLLGVIGLAWDRFGPRRTSGRRGTRSLGWLRPLAALSVTVFIVAAGTYVAIDAQQAIFPSSSKLPHGNGGGAGGGGSVGGSGSTNAQSPSAFGVGPSRGSAKSASCKQAKPASSGKPSPSQSIGQIQSPSPTPTPSDSSSGTVSPSPSDTDSSSAPATGATAPADQVSGAITSVTQSPAATVRHTVRRSTAPKATPSPCPKKTPVKHNPSGPAVHPNASTTVIIFGRLNDAKDSARLI